MNDMSAAIIPKSDQLNSDDLIAGPISITITDVTIRGGQEQPVSIHFDGDNGKPWKPCKSMSRVLVTAWGPDAKKYIGRSVTLYRDATVKWAGMEVGGIRISHLSDIEAPLTMALTATKGSRKPFTVRPFTRSTPQPSPSQAASPDSPPDAEAGGVDSNEHLELFKDAADAATWGTQHYQEWWTDRTPTERKTIGAVMHEQLKREAAQATVGA